MAVMQLDLYFGFMVDMLLSVMRVANEDAIWWTFSKRVGLPICIL